MQSKRRANTQSAAGFREARKRDALNPVELAYDLNVQQRNSGTKTTSNELGFVTLLSILLTYAEIESAPKPFLVQNGIKIIL